MVTKFLNEYDISFENLILDDTTTVGSDDAGSLLRYRFNLITTKDGNLVIGPGHTKFLHGIIYPEEYGNTDLHEFDSFNPYLIYLHHFISEQGSSGLIAGTADSLFQYNETKRQWFLIYNTTEYNSNVPTMSRWMSANLGNSILFTNRYGYLYHYKLNNIANQETRNDFEIVSDLKDVYNITNIGCLYIFNGVAFIANYVEDGLYKPDAIRWSQYADVKLWDEEKSSFPGEHRLEGEIILSLNIFNGSLLVATNKGFWIGVPTGSIDAPVAFQRIYHDPDGKKCLHYPFTLYSTGVDAVYLGVDGLYILSPDRYEPIKIDEINRGLGRLFSNIDPKYCYSPITTYYPECDAYLISYPVKHQGWLNRETVFISFDRKYVSYIDAGYNAFANYNMQYANFKKYTYASYIGSKIYCESNLENAVRPIEKADIFYTSSKYVDDSGVLDVEFENLFLQELPYDDTIRNVKYYFGDEQVTDVCSLSNVICSGHYVTIGIYCDDNRLKSITNVGYRDYFNGKEYIKKPLSAILGLGPINFESKKSTVNILHSISIYGRINVIDRNDLYALISCYVSNIPSDMAKVDCFLVKKLEKVIKLDCMKKYNLQQYERNNLVPINDIKIPTYISGNYHYLKIIIGGINSSGEFVDNIINKEFELSKVRLYYSRKM